MRIGGLYSGVGLSIPFFSLLFDGNYYSFAMDAHLFTSCGRNRETTQNEIDRIFFFNLYFATTTHITNKYQMNCEQKTGRSAHKQGATHFVRICDFCLIFIPIEVDRNEYEDSQLRNS